MNPNALVRYIITGTNRGLGKDTLSLLLSNYPDSHIIATARSNINEMQVQLSSKYPKNSIQVVQLDLGKKQSIDHFVQFIKDKQYYFDCLINNAAVGCDYGQQIPTVQLAKRTLQANIVGTMRLTNKLLPFLKQNGRVINVSSKLAALRFHGVDVVNKYNDPAITEQFIEKQVQKYIQGCQKGDVGQYFKSVYGTSKMMLNAWSRFILKNKLKNGQTAVVMSPGHCKTDMGRQHALRTSMQGAETIFSFTKGQYSPDIFYHLTNKYDFLNCGPK